MNSKKSLVLIGTAALCGLALAQAPSQRPPAERLDTLEKEVRELRVRLDAQTTAVEVQALQKELHEARAQVDVLTKWAASQADSARELALVLDDSQAKGFTYGINPDSRIVLLGGLRGFLAGMQKDAPKAPPAPVPPAEAGKLPVRDAR
jgi:hypothetical protein